MLLVRAAPNCMNVTFVLNGEVFTMSQATKRKYVTSEVLNEFVLPNENQTIVKIVQTKGNNLHMVTSSTGDTFLASMPQKFRKNVWIKRGDYVIIESIAEGDRVKGEIVVILYKDQIKHIQTCGLWPFDEAQSVKRDTLIPGDMLPPSDSDDSDLDSRVAVMNPNWQCRMACHTEASVDSDDSNEYGGKEKR